ncbi:cellulase family glycosylhydrolase [Marinicellulosiphila megalodicopiae]|uniref:cellulase family glycosylhydrolase n=1 Tax=Marinicellulosiphila megalodicopiae TaxID=2724896 RepID=UPI003BAF6F9D
MIFSKKALIAGLSSALVFTGCIKDSDESSEIKNKPPTVQINVGDGFYTAAATDPEEDLLTYSWEVAGLSYGQSETFTPSQTGLHGEKLVSVIVTDAAQNQVTKIISIDFGAVINLAPTADPILSGSILTANAKDPEGGNLTYVWKVGAVELSEQETFDINDAPVEIFGVQNVVLTVNDGNSEAHFTVDDVDFGEAPNNLPVIVMGNSITALTGELFQLSASATDADQDMLTFSWVLSDGQTAMGETPSFTINVEDEYIATLTVFDGADTVKQTVNISITEPNSIPVITLAEATDTELNAAATDDDAEDVLIFTWSVGQAEVGVGTTVLLSDAPFSIVGVQDVLLTVTDGEDSVFSLLTGVDFGTPTNEEIVEEYNGELPVVDQTIIDSAEAILADYDGSLPVPENVTKAAALILADTTGQQVSGGVIYIPTEEGGQPTAPYLVQVKQNGDVELVALPVPHIFDYGTENSFILDDFADNDHQNNLGGAVGTLHCENYTEGGGYWYVFGDAATTIVNNVNIPINPYNIIEAVSNQELHLKMNVNKYAGVGTNLVFEEYETDLTGIETIELTVRGSGKFIPMFEPIPSIKGNCDDCWGNYAAYNGAIGTPYELTSSTNKIIINASSFVGEQYSQLDGSADGGTQHDFIADGSKATKFFLQTKDEGQNFEIYIEKIEFKGTGLSIDDVGYKGMTKAESEAEIAHCDLDKTALDVPVVAEHPNLDYDAFAIKYVDLGQPDETVNTWVAPSLTDTGTLNWLSVDGRVLKDSKGNPVRLTGVNWFGFETKALIAMGLWTGGQTIDDMLQSIVDEGFNTVRIPFSDEVIAGSQNGSILLENLDIDLTANPIADQDGDNMLTPLDLLDVIVAKASAKNLKIVLDSHSRGSDQYLVEGHWVSDNPTATFGTEEQWIQNWEMLALRYKNEDAVVGFDLNNEPHFQAAWGSNEASDNWNEAAKRAADRIQVINENVLIIVEGVEHLNGDQQMDDMQKSLESYWWGGNLQGVVNNPIILTRDQSKLVYSPHEYGPEVYTQPWFKVAGFPRNLPYLWEDRFGFIYQDNIGHLFVGEFGIKHDIPGSASNIWFESFLDYMCARKEGFSWTYWAWNPNSGDTGGILGNDWEQINGWKVNLLQGLNADGSNNPNRENCQAPLIGNNNG